MKKRRVFFLDRDGVINKRMPPHEYVTKWEDFEFLPGVVEALKMIIDMGGVIFVITNQRGIARGLMSENDLRVIHNMMQAELLLHGVVISGIYYCPHDKGDDCDCRKPRIGMFLRASREHDIDLRSVVYIGDDDVDRLAGEAAGCETVILSEKQNLLAIVSSFQNKLS